MTNNLDPITTHEKDPLICCYINATSKIQIARITNIQNWYFERVVFPGQRLIFEASVEANLEIHTGMMASAILSDTIACIRLRVDKPVTETDTTDDSQSKTINEEIFSNPESSQVKTCVPSATTITSQLHQDLELSDMNHFKIPTQVG